VNDLDLIDNIRQALLTALVLCTPVLLVGVVVGVITGALQAVTQVHYQSISFAPKLLVTLALLVGILPWIMQFLADYAVPIFSGTP